jgi:APA family basic amino acid/polyamine antiporter
MGLFDRKPIAATDESGTGMRRTLGAGDLVMLAIGAVIGAGIFSSLGTAAAGETLADGTVIRYGAGPALVLSFILLGAVCGLAALCYAELSAMIPQAGSAYAYSYATLGEIVAWIVGWALILEYAVGNVAVAIGWSGYFTSLLSGFGVDLPGWLTHGYWNVKASGDPAIRGLMESAPRIAGVPVLVNLPAFGIVVAITLLLLKGVKESARANNIMVVIKLLVLALFVIVGGMHIDPANYKPFAPNGFRGIHQGAAIVFFAYIGFDAVSTTAEEARNPQRDIPIGIIASLVICTLLYITVAAVLTGMIPWQQVDVNAPIATALQQLGFRWGAALVAIGAVAGITSVLLVMMIGQIRIFFVMARDGLLGPWLGAVHPRYRTPHHATVLTGVVVAVLAGFVQIGAAADMANIGTLFAFVLVCIGVVVLRRTRPAVTRPFRVPFMPVLPVLGAIACFLLMTGLPWVTWLRFCLWTALGIVVYLAYGLRRSRLAEGA